MFKIPGVTFLVSASFLFLITSSPSSSFAASNEVENPAFILESENRSLGPMSSHPLSTANLGRNEIAITIDDGPSPEYNAVVLKTLRDHGVKATFFLVGWRAQRYPELVKNILREGHAVGNHSWKHPMMNRIGIARATKEIVDTQNVLERIASEVGIPVQPYFRFPYGAGASSAPMMNLLTKLGMRNFMWSMSVKDSETKDAAKAYANASRYMTTTNHGILLMHETHVAGVKALPRVLLEMKRRNYKTIYFKEN